MAYREARKRTAELLEAHQPGDNASRLVDVLVAVLKREARVLTVVLFILAIILTLAAWGMYQLERSGPGHP